MRKSISFALFALIFTAIGQAQPCLPNGITFSTQAQINNFPNTNPGCTMIGGNVTITGQDIINLTGLSMIKTIGGDLNVYNNPILTTLNGLGNLTAVDGSIWLQENYAITSLSSLSSLTTIGGNLSIDYTNALTSLNGLENLTQIGGSLSLKYHAALTNLNALGNLTTIGGSLSIASDAALVNLNGLEHIQTITGSIGIYNDDALINVNGLNNLTSVGQSFQLSQNPVLTDVNGLSNLKTVGREISIAYNPALSTISGLSNLEAVGGIWIENDDALTNINVFGNITAVDEDVSISGNAILASLNGLENISSVGRRVTVSDNAVLNNLSGLSNLSAIGDGLIISDNAVLSSLNGIGSVASLGGDLIISNNPQLLSLSSLGNAITVIDQGLNISNNSALTDLNGLGSLTAVNYWMIITGNTALLNLNALGNIESSGGLVIQNNASLTNLDGLSKLKTVEFISISGNGLLQNLSGLQHITTARSLEIAFNASLSSLNGLGNLSTVTDSFTIHNNALLSSISGLSKLTNAGRLGIYGNPALTSLTGLENLTSLQQVFSGAGSLLISGNATLANINALQSLTGVGWIQITDNPLLPDCAIFAVCNHIINDPNLVTIANNAPGCNTASEVQLMCHSIPVIAEVRLDDNHNCLPDPTDTPASDVQVRLEGTAQMLLKPTNLMGSTQFGYLESGPFVLHLPQFPAGNWAVCQEPVTLNPNGSNDTLRATLLLSPLINCPELTVHLGMPSFFRGCLTTSDLEVFTQNTGTITAQGVKVAVVMPSVLELMASAPPLDAQSGDTLYFDLGDLPAFGKSNVLLTVRTRCDTFLLGQTLCLETFAALDNPCPNTLPGLSEIKLSAKCIGDTIVRFNLKNIGDAPTQGWHAYKVIRNDMIQYDNAFQLNAQQSLSFDFPADGATWRMEATKFDDGTETAVALEHCGGLTPGLITAFWLDHGPLQYDFDCRLVNGSYDPNLKSAVPTGTGGNNTIGANEPLQYTIDFQNTGTDTAFRVLLRDELPEGLDLNTFRPGFASHNYTWEIRGRTLEVLFSPIALPSINVNEPASHGFFSFNIDQKPNLSDGASFLNTASIIFDFNPPIYTNYVYHWIGKLTVKVDEPQEHADLWQVLGNPTHDVATFQALEEIAGEKYFELYEASGRHVRSTQFLGQSLEFQRDMLHSGLYFFRITDAKGRVFSGKIGVTD